MQSDRSETSVESVSRKPLALEQLLAVFEGYGGTDRDYLKHHYQRYVATLKEFDHSWDRGRGVQVLDVGAHWLHQALLWQRAGYAVTALDLPITFDFENVRRAADSEGIRLISNADLEHPVGFSHLSDDSFDIILFAEIIEHLTFNPIALWKEIHRVLRPGGRLVITTPNYYAWNGRAWEWKRFLSGFGGGLSVDAILNINTYGHHWREFSKHELIRYFCLLSPDFNTVKAKTMRNYYPTSDAWRPRARQSFWEMIPGLRPNLHLEIELDSKSKGIVLNPGW